MYRQQIVYPEVHGKCYTKAMTIGARIKESRKRLGVTQDALAKLCGWKRGKSRISNYECDRRGLTLANLHRLADALEVDVVWLTFGIDAGVAVDEEEQALLSMWRATAREGRTGLLQFLLSKTPSGEPPARTPPVLRVVPRRRKDDR